MKSVSLKEQTTIQYHQPSRELIVIRLMFVFSLSVVVAKFYINYGRTMQSSIKQDDPSRLDALPRLYDVFNLSSIPGLSNSIANQVVATFSTKYDWLIRATLCGVVITAFSWFIIYMDSRVPGIDPPFPLHFLKRKGYRIRSTLHINLNYLIGVLVGLLVFIFMCFDR